MSREKQIEEMTKDLFSAYAINKLYTEDVAEYLYNAGYRKQIEGEWLVDAWDNEKEEWVTIPYNKHLHADAFCSLCKEHALLDGKEYGVASNYCPKCGAKMKGGAE